MCNGYSSQVLFIVVCAHISYSRMVGQTKRENVKFFWSKSEKINFDQGTGCGGNNKYGIS